MPEGSWNAVTRSDTSRPQRHLRLTLAAALVCALALLAGPAIAVAEAFSEGQLVRLDETGAVYRIAGGAPLYVSTFDAIGGPQPTTPISAAQLAALPSVPADGTLLDASGGGVFVVAGGAPLYLSSYDAIGGPRAGINVDQWDVDFAGRNPEAHLNSYPANGTFLSTSASHVYRVAGGAPFLVSSWASFGGVQPSVGVDQWDVDHLANPLAHLRATPVDGAELLGVPSNVGWVVKQGRKRATGVDGAAVLLEDAAIGGVPDVLTATSGSAIQSATVGSLVLRGSGFSAGDTVRAADGDIAILAVRATDSSHLTVTAAVSAGAAPGARDLVVGAADGASALCVACLTVTAASGPATVTDATATKGLPATARFTVSVVKQNGRVVDFIVYGAARGATVRVTCVVRCGKKRALLAGAHKVRARTTVLRLGHGHPLRVGATVRFTVTQRRHASRFRTYRLIRKLPYSTFLSGGCLDATGHGRAC